MAATKAFQGVLAALLSLVLLVPASDALDLFKNFGEIKAGEEATRTFENHQVVSTYRYYISGSDLYPDALIAVDKAYTLSGDLWKEVEKITPAKLKEIVGYMKSRGLEVGQSLYGFDILDPKGKKVGLWYSILRARTNVKLEEENTLMIYTPPLNVWEKREHERIIHGVPR